MGMRANLFVLVALFGIGAVVPAGAQTVYKCGTARSVTYTEKPCSRRIVNTDQAPVPVRPNAKQVDLRRQEQNRAVARTLRTRPGETTAQFETRRRRAGLLAADSAECARLETRMPVEEARMNNPDPEEVSHARAALGQARKQFRELRC